MARPLTLSLLNSAGENTLPSGWKSPLREGGKPKKLYQCVVETKDGPLRVGPAMIPDVTQHLCEELGKAIAGGKIHGWGMPQIICITQGV